MEPSVFTDKSSEPDAAQLARALGDSHRIWVDLLGHIEQTCGPLSGEWKYYSKKSGWTRKTLIEKRNLFFFTPLDGYFRLGFVFGDRAADAVEASDLSEKIKHDLRNARRYVEGRGFTVEVRTREDIEPVKVLVAIKMEN